MPELTNPPTPGDPITLHWRLPFLVLSVTLVLVVALFAASAYFEREEDANAADTRRSLIDELAETRDLLESAVGDLRLDDAIDDCRAVFEKQLDAAEVARHIADDQNTISIAVAAGVELPPPPPYIEVVPLPEALVRLDAAEAALNAAQRALDDYDDDPVANCPAAQQAQEAIDAAEERARRREAERAEPE